MPNFVWPPPFLPPPIPIQPPPVAIPDIHFFPIPPHPGMAVVGAPVLLPMPIQTKAPAPPAVLPPPMPTPAQQPKLIETGYHTMTTTTFIPIGTLAEPCYQKPKKSMVKAEATHSLVTNNFYGPLSTPGKPPVAESGKKPEKTTPPAPISIHHPAPVEQRQGEERCYHYHTHRFPNPAFKYDRRGSRGASSPDTETGEFSTGNVKIPPKQKEQETMKAPEAHAELKTQEKGGKTRTCPSEISHPISEAVKPNDHHHHYYYTQGGAYAFPFPIPTQPTLASQAEHQATLQTLAEMQDAIRNLQLAQAARTPRVAEVDPPLPETQILPENVHHGPEADDCFHITAAGCENAKAEKPNATSPEATSPVQQAKPENEPGLVHPDRVPSEPAKPNESQYSVSCPHGCPPFPHQHFGPQYHASHMQFPRPLGGLPFYQPGFNYSATYQAAGVNSPGYPYAYHPQGSSYPGMPMDPNYRVRRRSGRKKGYKRTYGESEGSSSEGESYYTRASRSASVGESRSCSRQRGRPEPKSPQSKQDESSSKVPNLEARKSPKVAFSIPVSAQSNINPSTPNLLSTSFLSSPSSAISSSSSSSSSPSSSPGSDSEEAIFLQRDIPKESKRIRKSADGSPSESSIDSDPSRDKNTSAESTVALAKDVVTNVALKFADSIRADSVKFGAVQRSEPEETTEETQEAIETTASGQKGKLTTEPSAGSSSEKVEIVILENSEGACPLPPRAATANASPWATLLSSIEATVEAIPPPPLPGSDVAMDTDLGIHITSISEKVNESTSTCAPTAHLSSSKHPLAPPALPTPPSKKVAIVEAESDEYISGEESNTEELDVDQSGMDGKELITPLLVPITQNKHKHKCGCQCCEERRGKRGKRKDTGNGKGGKRRREKGEKQSSKRKHIGSDCHFCKIEGAHGAAALYKVHEKKFEEKTESRSSMLRDMALGACAGGLGYLVGTMVNRKQTQKKAEKKSTNPFKLFGIGMGKPAGGEVAHGSAQLSDNDGVYKLSEIPPTPTPPKGCVFPAANAKPVYPGWNDEPPNLVASEGVSSPSNQRPVLARATVHPTSPPPEHLHRNHHHRGYYEGKKYKAKAGTYSIDLPKETLLGPGGKEENKEGNVKLVIHMKNGKGGWVDMEKGRQGGAAAPPVVANNSHAEGAFMRGALHHFTVDREAPFPPGESVAATTIERKKAPYPPAVYIESDISELSTPPFLHRQYSDVSELESPFLPTTTPTSAFPRPPHNQHLPAHPQPLKTNIASAYDPPKVQSPWQPEHHGHYMLPMNLPPPPAPHDLIRVSFQHPPVRQQHQKQPLELPPDSDENEWWRSGGSGEEGGVELDTGIGMGVVDPPLRKRI